MEDSLLRLLNHPPNCSYRSPSDYHQYHCYSYSYIIQYHNVQAAGTAGASFCTCASTVTPLVEKNFLVHELTSKFTKQSPRCVKFLLSQLAKKPKQRDFSSSSSKLLNQSKPLINEMWEENAISLLSWTKWATFLLMHIRVTKAPIWCIFANDTDWHTWFVCFWCCGVSHFFFASILFQSKEGSTSGNACLKWENSS